MICNSLDHFQVCIPNWVGRNGTHSYPVGLNCPIFIVEEMCVLNNACLFLFNAHHNTPSPTLSKWSNDFRYSCSCSSERPFESRMRIWFSVSLMARWMAAMSWDQLARNASMVYWVWGLSKIRAASTACAHQKKEKSLLTWLHYTYMYIVQWLYKYACSTAIWYRVIT